MKNPVLLLGAIALMTLAACDHTEPTTAAPAPTPLIEKQCLYMPGDYNSTNWRIPALLCLDDGTLLAVNDKRKYNETDLPEDIDIVCRRSTDMGHTWSEPQTIAQGTGVKHGFGDAALVQCQNGDVICAFVGGNGFLYSTATDPLRSYICRSKDRGLTWSEPEEITPQLWGSQATNTACRNYCSSFFASGNGLRLTQGTHAGRIMFAAAMRKTNGTIDNYVVYSDDNGTTWQVSNRAFHNGDEAKLTQLRNGDILISVRRTGERGHNRSSDGGHTWGIDSTWSDLVSNACNGDMLRVNDTLLLHSLPNSLQREKVSIFRSTDEGRSWHAPVLMFDGPSVYSSLTLLPDGTIGTYIEQNPTGQCELWFYRFNLEWLLTQ